MTAQVAFDFGLTDEEQAKMTEREAYAKRHAMYEKRGLYPPTWYDRSHGKKDYDPRAVWALLKSRLPKGEWINWMDLCHLDDPYQVHAFVHVLELMVRHRILIEKPRYYVGVGKNPWVDPHRTGDSYLGFQSSYTWRGTPDPVWIDERELPLKGE